MSDGTEVPCALCGARDTARLYIRSTGASSATAAAVSRTQTRARPKRPSRLATVPSISGKEYLPAIGAPEGRVDPDFMDQRHVPMLALIRARAPQGRRLLEVGRGAAGFLAAGKPAGWDVAGLELSLQGATFARDRLGLEVRTERAETMIFPPGSFDLAVMFDVIEHLFDPRAVLEATRRALKPGGALVVSTPNLDALSRRALGEAWAVLSPLEHLYSFTEGTLARMVESCGFSDVAFERRFAGWGPVEAMNYHYTYAPAHWRARLSGALVTAGGTRLARVVQGRGGADALLCTAWV